MAMFSQIYIQSSPLNPLTYTVNNGLKHTVSLYLFSLHIEIALSLKISVNNERVFFFLLSRMLMHYSLRKKHMPHSNIPDGMVTLGPFLCWITFLWS